MNETPQERIERLVAYWDTHSAPTDGYQQVVQPSLDPMVVFSLRLPKETADLLRAAAQVRGMKPTELAREWLSHRLNHPDEHDPATDVVAGQLEQLAAQLRAS